MYENVEDKTQMHIQISTHSIILCDRKNQTKSRKSHLNISDTPQTLVMLLRKSVVAG